MIPVVLMRRFWPLLNFLVSNPMEFQMNAASHFLIIYSLIPDRQVILLVPVADLDNTAIQKILESHGQVANTVAHEDYDGEWMCNFVENNKQYHVFDSDSVEDTKPPLPMPPNTTIIVAGFHL